jgi:hypothetical protein
MLFIVSNVTDQTLRGHAAVVLLDEHRLKNGESNRAAVESVATSQACDTLACAGSVRNPASCRDWTLRRLCLELIVLTHCFLRRTAPSMCSPTFVTERAYWSWFVPTLNAARQSSRKLIWFTLMMGFGGSLLRCLVQKISYFAAAEWLAGQGFAKLLLSHLKVHATLLANKTGKDVKIVLPALKHTVPFWTSPSMVRRNKYEITAAGSTLLC